MRRRLLKSKIHGATVTDASVEYEGSITIDRDLMEAADFVEYEKVHVWDITNGQRLMTYVIEGEGGSGVIAMNGAAARLIGKGDKLIIGTYADYDEKEVSSFTVRKIFLDANNQIKKV
ncbi:MAG: aspartate 1-decarboxylase [Deltaproteobacteria bacterium]|nr:aspartate 1-decarboxylase [Deltaproteobacteria bacterium]